MNNNSPSDPLYFWKVYELLSSSKTYVPACAKHTVCRYCNKSVPETTFNQETHLLPELLGENNLLTFDECDECNKVFSGYESNLSIFIRPYITLLGIKGKHGTPSFQSRSINRDDDTRTRLNYAKDGRRELILTNPKDYRINPENKTLEVLFRKPRFRPISIYKALVKIGLSLTPKEFDKYNRNSFDWLVGKVDESSFFNHAFLTTLNRSYFREPSVELYKAKQLFRDDLEFPEYTLVLYFANQIMQIFLPFSDELLTVSNGKRNLEVNIFPAFAVDKNNIPAKVEIKTFNLGISETVTEDHKIFFSYQNAELNLPPGMLE